MILSQGGLAEVGWTLLDQRSLKNKSSQ